MPSLLLPCMILLPSHLSTAPSFLLPRMILLPSHPLYCALLSSAWLDSPSCPCLFFVNLINPLPPPLASFFLPPSSILLPFHSFPLLFLSPSFFCLCPRFRTIFTVLINGFSPLPPRASYQDLSATETNKRGTVGFLSGIFSPDRDDF